jgi:CRISPR type IV-associated protein Csf1
MISPTIKGQHTEKGKTYPVVSGLPTRAEMRAWLLFPPSPPFRIIIAESGQKHILPWARVGHSRDCFPVQLELDSVWVDHREFTGLLGAYESLMALGFSKTEINSGSYHSDRLMRAIALYQDYEDIVAPYRGGRLLQLVAHVAQQASV